jgi:hypothetical protein
MGKPTTRNGVVLTTESIGVERYTRGTETSKYPEEKKTTVIPSVAASERGLAQTAWLRPIGVAGRLTWSYKSAE